MVRRSNWHRFPSAAGKTDGAQLSAAGFVAQTRSFWRYFSFRWNFFLGNGDQLGLTESRILQKWMICVPWQTKIWLRLFGGNMRSRSLRRNLMPRSSAVSEYGCRSFEIMALDVPAVKA